MQEFKQVAAKQSVLCCKKDEAGSVKSDNIIFDFEARPSIVILPRRYRNTLGYYSGNYKQSSKFQDDPSRH